VRHRRRGEGRQGGQGSPLGEGGDFELYECTVGYLKVERSGVREGVKGRGMDTVVLSLNCICYVCYLLL
jgi:hypothetical protein